MLFILFLYSNLAMWQLKTKPKRTLHLAKQIEMFYKKKKQRERKRKNSEEVPQSLFPLFLCSKNLMLVNNSMRLLTSIFSVSHGSAMAAW